MADEVYTPVISHVIRYTGFIPITLFTFDSTKNRVTLRSSKRRKVIYRFSSLTTFYMSQSLLFKSYGQKLLVLLIRSFGLLVNPTYLLLLVYVYQSALQLHSNVVK